MTRAINGATRHAWLSLRSRKSSTPRRRALSGTIAAPSTSPEDLTIVVRIAAMTKNGRRIRASRTTDTLVTIAKTIDIRDKRETTDTIDLETRTEIYEAAETTASTEEELDRTEASEAADSRVTIRESRGMEIRTNPDGAIRTRTRRREAAGETVDGEVVTAEVDAREEECRAAATTMATAIEATRTPHVRTVLRE